MRREGFRPWVPAITAAAYLAAVFNSLRPGLGHEVAKVCDAPCLPGEGSVAYVYASGWPFRAYTATCYIKEYPFGGNTHCGPIEYARIVGGETRNYAGAYEPAIVPHTLHPWAAAGNVLVEGALLALSLICIVNLAAWIIEMAAENKRIARGGCARCGYPQVSPNVSCPECGAAPTE